MTSPTISVAMVTFNHREHIARAIQSVLDQSIVDRVELIVGDDASTDGTSSVVAELAARHPRVVQHHRRPQNRGMHRNFESVLTACSGRYVAILDGDDYWVSLDKLERQLELLESNRHLVGCFHGVERVSSTDDQPGPARGGSESAFEIGTEELLRVCQIVTCSVMFRREAFGSYPAWSRALPVAEWPLFLQLSKRGRFAFQPGLSAVHRYHAGGTWTSLARVDRIRSLLGCYLAFHREFGRASRRHIVDGIETHVLNSIRYLEDSGADSQTLRSALTAYSSALLRLRRMPSRDVALRLFRLTMPTVYSALRSTRRPLPRAHRRAIARHGDRDASSREGSLLD